jgi:hypothetical protein
MPCQISSANSLDGYDKDQEKQMRCRKRPYGQTEQEKWIELYQILFPEVEKAAIPHSCEYERKKTIRAMLY